MTFLNRRRELNEIKRLKKDGSFAFEEARQLFAALSLNEEPMGVYYSSRKPTECITPPMSHLPTFEEEQCGEANLGEVLKTTSCIFQSILRARRNRIAACFDREHYGCLGGAFALGFNKPQLEIVVRYVSTGLPGTREGELYAESPELSRMFFEYVNPRLAPAEYTIFKPLSKFDSGDVPELVVFFDRPEVISGLHQLAGFVMHDPEAVCSPMGAGCFNAVTWPLKYMCQGEMKAVLGSWDPSCRRYFRIDEITFSMPYEMLRMMAEHWKESFLGITGNSTWEMVRKRARLSQQRWGEKMPDWNSV